MATVFFGMCHTFKYPQKIQADQEASYNSSLFYLDPNLNYRIMIHDSKFYHVLVKHSVFPRVWLEYKAGQNMAAGHYDYYEIFVTQHHLLNRPEQPCEEAEDYDFLGCVKTNQAKMLGCRPPWDIWSPPTIPLCQTMDQLLEYEKFDTGLFAIMRKKKFLKTSGCKVPCNYKVGVHCSPRMFP